MATQTTQKKWDNEECGVAWKRKTAKGESYLTGTFKVGGKDVQFVGFTNKTKKADNHPDIRFYISKPREASKPAPAPTVQETAPVDNELI